MGKGSVASKFLMILNIIYFIIGAGLIALSVLFYMKIDDLISLRNPYHFALDETIMYWPQAIPLIYAIIGLFILLISSCAFLGVAKKSRAVILTHATFQILIVFALVGAAAVTLMKADSKDNKDFIAATIENAFHHMRDERGGDVKKGFADLEMSLQCCGATNSTNYNLLGRNSHNYQYELPVSCCNTEYTDEKVKICASDDILAQSRPGCTQIVNLKVRHAFKFFAGAAIFTAFIGLLNLMTAVCLSKALMNKKKSVKQPKENGAQRRSNIVISTQEFEFDKMEKAPLKV